MASCLVTHYTVIEQIFVAEDTDHTRAVKNSLLALYTAILNFLIEALGYFPPVHHDDNDKHWLRSKLSSGAGKAKRAFRSLDPTAQITAKSLLETVTKAKADVDTAAQHAYAAKNVELLGEFGEAQDQILEQLQNSGLGQQEVQRRLEAMREELRDPLYSIDDKVSSLYDQMERTQQLAELTRVLDWLSPAAQESRRKTYHKSLGSPTNRLPGSGRWLLEDQEYLQWQNSKGSSVACLSGIEGTGKTMLLSAVIDHLQSRILDNGDPDHLAFFYASAQEGNFWGNPDEVIRSIIRQLSATQAGTTLEPAAKQKCDELTSKTTEPSRPVMSECVDIALALTSYFPVVILIDGLDELQAGNATEKMQSSRNDLIESLHEIFKKSSNPVKLFFSVLSDGPAEARLRRMFATPAMDDTKPPDSWHIIEVNGTKNSGDVSTYVDKEMAKRISSGDLLEGEVDGELRDMIKNRLLERSNGMFSYATMQIERLCDDRMDRITVLEELDKPLPGITTFYDESIESIRNETIDRVRLTAQTTLRWLLCIQEPLPLHSFLEAVIVEGGINKPKESNLLNACRRLVKTDHYAGVLVFRHPSVREHLGQIPEYSNSDCHLVAAERCLRMMIAASSSVSRLSPAQVRFYWYAKLYWSLHYQRVNFNDDAEDKTLNDKRQKAVVRVKELVRKFLMQGHKTSPAFNKWIAQIPDFIEELGEQSPLSKQLKSLQASLEDPLHVICVFGLAQIIEAHYKHLNFNQRNVHGQTALCLAVENRQLETVKVLLTHGRVDVNEFNVKAVYQLHHDDFSPIICYASALQAAAVQGSKAIIQTLVDHGARVGLVAGYYGCALQAACVTGHGAAVDYLLTECNADTNSQGGYHGNALQAAAAAGQLNIVERLLAAGACETASGGHYGSAFMAATIKGSKEIIECLLAHTTDPKFLANMKSERYGTPLQRAADMDRVDIVDLLIANDADINAVGGGGREGEAGRATSALAVAAWSGHNKIVSILCSLGAEADMSYTNGQFHIIHQAAVCNMLDLVNYCMDAGCDPNMGASKGGPRYYDLQGDLTPLSFASAEGHVEVVQLLIQRGARICFPTSRITCLHLAASGGHCQVIDELIKRHRERHIDNPQDTLDFINRRIGGESSTALLEAITVTSHDAVSLLLANGADFTAMDDGVGPLHLAARQGKARIVEILVNHIEASGNRSIEDQVNLRSHRGESPLHHAAARNRMRVSEFLLQHGADPTTKDNDNNTILHCAACRNHDEIAKQILGALDKRGAETKVDLLAALNASGNTALEEAILRQHFQIIPVLLAGGAKLGGHRSFLSGFAIARKLDIGDIKRFIKAFDGYPEELSKLLNNRSLVDGYSLLHSAAEHNRPGIAELILQHGADATAMDGKDGLDPDKVDMKTPLHIAVWKGRREVFDLLLNYARQQCDPAKLDRFINRRDTEGKTALIDGAERNRREMIKILLEDPFNADWSITDNRGYNALHYRTFHGRTRSANILLRHASSVGDDTLSRQKFAAFINQQTTSDLVTPLHDITLRGFQELAMLLLEKYGADYEVYDIHGDSILHRAVQANHEELLEPYLAFMSKDKDQEKFKRVLLHKNKSQGRTVREACEVRGRTERAELVKRYGG